MPLALTVTFVCLSIKLSDFYNGLMLSESVPSRGSQKFQELISLLQRLRSPSGCPWDREQTHKSLKRHLLEECYEVLEAIDENNNNKLVEELGDLLVQIISHGEIGFEGGAFGIDDILTIAKEKLIRRHPHVFGDATVVDAREVEEQWEKIKKMEDRGRSPVSGIPNDLPALAYAELMQHRVGKAGFDWEDFTGVVDKLVEEVNEVRTAETSEEVADELGDVLFTLVNAARWMGVSAEDCLRKANLRFKRRYTIMEKLASQKGLNFLTISLEQKESLWKQAKMLD